MLKLQQPAPPPAAAAPAIPEKGAENPPASPLPEAPVSGK